MRQHVGYVGLLYAKEKNDRPQEQNARYRYISVKVLTVPEHRE